MYQASIIFPFRTHIINELIKFFTKRGEDLLKPNYKIDFKRTKVTEHSGAFESYAKFIFEIKQKNAQDFSLHPIFRTIFLGIV